MAGRGTTVPGGVQQRDPPHPPTVRSTTGANITAFVHGDQSSNQKPKICLSILNETLWLKHLAFFCLFFKITVAKDNRNICLMINDVKKRRNRKEAAVGKSLSVYSSRLLLYVSSYESEIRKSGGNVGLIMSVQSSSVLCVCVRVLGVSVRVPLRVRGLSVCVHVVIGCVRGSSQGGWRLRFGRRLLVSALVEQHVGRFSLREEEGTVTRQKHTPDADTWHWGAAANAPECRKLSDREECSPQSDPLRRRTRCCRQSNTTFHPLYSCRKLCLFRQRRSRMNTCLLCNPRSKIQQVHWIF